MCIGASEVREGLECMIEELNHEPVSFLQVRFNNPSSDDVYLSCDGVQQGVATGDTWPLPPCFADHTHTHTAPPAPHATPRG